MLLAMQPCFDSNGEEAIGGGLQIDEEKCAVQRGMWQTSEVAYARAPTTNSAGSIFFPWRGSGTTPPIPFFGITQKNQVLEPGIYLGVECALL